MKRTLLLLLSYFAFVCFACQQKSDKANSRTTYHERIYQTELDQFGYDIYKDSILLIHQPIVPTVIGHKGFASKEDAYTAAKLVISKLEHGIMPPSITLTELDSLHIKIPKSGYP
ncbi:MAG TPA: DUF4907 domain-containing protein [Legionellaceae bacterium]|nr:DUF4907 domain-containing protein [Legionellaceae bacterium]